MNNDAAFNTLLASIRVALLTAGGSLVTSGAISQGVWAQIQLWIGIGTVAATAAWSIWNAWTNYRRSRAQAVAAGINLALSGHAVTDDGTVINTVADPSATPPKTPTMKTAEEIIKDFAPPAASIAKK